MPKPRSASLQVAHQRDCTNATKTSLDSLDGCTCKPSYYTSHRQGHGVTKGPRLRNRQVAERALRKLLVELDEDRAEVGPSRRDARTFDEWADEYLRILEEDKRDKGSTIRAYESTLGHVRPILGRLDLDEIGVPEIRRVLKAIRANGNSDATQHKHLRHLRAVLTAAVEEGYARSNPLTRKFMTDLRLERPNHVESYTDTELGKLWPQMEALKYEDVYIYVTRAAVATGARLGELVALNWDDLRLGERELDIQHHYDMTDGMTTPKNGHARTNFLIEDAEADAINAVGLFERWTRLVGVQPGDAPIFPAPRSGGRLNAQYVRKLVDKARREAGIADVGEGGGKRRPFHALRGSHSRITRERGYEPWLRQHNLGHSTIEPTDNVYGRPSRDALRTAARQHATAQVEPQP
ncbi:MAG TPA: site-specific integrase [Gaiellaceae bacterium]